MIFSIHVPMHYNDNVLLLIIIFNIYCCTYKTYEISHLYIKSILCSSIDREAYCFIRWGEGGGIRDPGIGVCSKANMCVCVVTRGNR